MNIPYLNRRTKEVQESIDLVLEYIDSTFYCQKPFKISEIMTFITAAQQILTEIQHQIDKETE